MITAIKKQLDKAKLHRYYRMIEEFRTIDPDMPVQQIATFLFVATREGSSVKAISAGTGQVSSSTSRNIAALSKYHRLNKPGLDLIEAREDPADRRYKTVHLTPKGHMFAENLIYKIETTEEKEKGESKEL
ncbi:MarR family winged helix-turn-helix transcriptional regulator [Imhoffiella purpurea]|uniref:MarR family winged helix-turn-helix transcriptional regulator n=1 Tax=Imhoffiella purpurea TaxID=1249627 RepID=UPI0006943B7A|nr:MarR family winged helix-turn-helix transcriptional regulator [Imhoffiella purpurea]